MLRCRILFVVLAMSIILALGASALTRGPELILRGARIVDGTGRPAFQGDIAVKQGRIVALGEVSAAAPVEIDAIGLVAAPGFIDVHTHADGVTRYPRAESFVRMGVTSVVAGNCGGSAADVGLFLRRVDEQGASVNVATLAGHNTVRSAAMGGSFDRPPTPEELEAMKAHVDQAMRDGAVGLSTGLIYMPGLFAETEEIVALARVAAARGGVYATHMRNEGNGILGALAETVRVAREAGIPAHVSHIKLSGDSAWGRSGAVLDALHTARAEGLRVTQDMYVYTASSTGIGVLIPATFREGGRERLAECLKDPATKAKVVAAMKARLRENGRQDYAFVAIASCAADPSLNGSRVPEAARRVRGSNALEAQIEAILEIECRGGAGCVFHGIHEEDLRAFLGDPNTMIASDSGIRQLGEGVPHPRGYGNNARVLARYVREEKLLSLEEAVRRMTSLPAETFGLRDRGVLREGAWADITLFDPERVRDTATFDDPHHYPEGIRHVLVNGVPVVKDGEHTGATPGRALRGPAAG